MARGSSSELQFSGPDAVRSRTVFVEQIMGLPFSLHLRGPAADTPATAALVAGTFAEIRRIEQIFSPFHTGSDVCRINRRELAVEDSHPRVLEVLRLGETAQALTDGRFSVWLPDRRGRRRLDPSGIVKGWAAQRAFAHLESATALDICLNAGGDVMMGTAAGGPPWRVGIENPGSDHPLGSFACSAGAVATSGTSARGAHLVDPRPGARPGTLRQVSVIGPSLLWADVFATAAFVGGEVAPTWLGAQPDYDCVVLDLDGRVSTTRSS